MKKTKIPSKQTLNLVIKEKTLASPTRLIPILLLIFLGAYAFAQFAVINRLNQVKRAEAELAEMYNQLHTIESTYVDFDEVEAEYNRYTYRNFDRTIPDRLDVLAMIERQLFPLGTVQNISISGRTVTLTLTGPNLEDVSWLYVTLVSDPLVEDIYISSYNDNSNRDQSGESTTTIPMTIYLVDATTLGREEEAEDAEAPETDESVGDTADGEDGIDAGDDADSAENGNVGTENGGEE